MKDQIIKIFQKHIFSDGDVWIIYDLKKMYDELLPIIKTTDMKDKIIAYEWHNEATGHCYVDYIAHSSMDEINGYVKTPLYKAEDVNYITGHGLDKLIATEVERQIQERLPICDCENCIYNEHHSPASAEAVINGGDDSYDYDYCAKDYWCGQPENDYPKRTYCEHFCSRLTENNSAKLSQNKQINATELPNKQEGGAQCR